MACEVYLDVRELECDQLRPLLASRVGPLPRLEMTGRRRRVEQRFAVLQNDFTRVEIALDLGGRIWRIIDRVRGGDILRAPEEIVVSAAEPWGAQVATGAILKVSGPMGTPALGPVSFRLHEPEAESDSASVVLFGLVPGAHLSWHASYELSPDSAALRVALRTFNRALDWTPAWIEWRLEGFAPGTEGEESLTASHPAGHLVALGDVEAVKMIADEGAVCWRRAQGDLLEPRATDSWEVFLWALAGQPSPDGVQRGVAGRIDAEGISLNACRPIAQARLIVQTEGHGALEANVHLGPSDPVFVATTVFPSRVLGYAVKSGPDIVFASDSPPRTEIRPPSSPRENMDFLSWTPAELRAALRVRSLRHPATLALAAHATRQSDLAGAKTLVDDSLLYDGEDSLAWWLRAALGRLTGQEAEVETALANAHFLAPLEPMLRAEALLSSPVPEGDGPHPLLEPLADDPDAMVEVACQLLDAGMHEAGARWIEECRRWQDVPMLRVLLADLMLAESKYATEAAQWVAGLDANALGPPFPWRRREKEAIARLFARFPGSEALRALSEAQ